MNNFIRDLMGQSVKLQTSFGEAMVRVYNVECEKSCLYDPVTYRIEFAEETDYNFMSKRLNIPKNTVPSIKKVIFNNDGTKTVVKCDGEDYDPEKGMAMAIAKKALCNKGNYYNTFKKWLPVPKPLSNWQDVVNAFTKLGEDFKKFNGRKKDRDE